MLQGLIVTVVLLVGDAPNVIHSTTDAGGLDQQVACPAHLAHRLTQLGEPKPTVNLSHEQRYIIKEFLKDTNAPKVADDVEVKIGELAPPTAPMQPFPDEVYDKVPPIRTHFFFLQGERVVVVNPKTRRIADIID